MAILAALNTATVNVESSISLAAGDPRKLMEGPIAGSFGKSSLPNEGNVTSIAVGEKIRLNLGDFTGNTLWFHCVCNKGLDANDDAVIVFEDKTGTQQFYVEIDAGAGTDANIRTDGITGQVLVPALPAQLDFEFNNGSPIRVYVNGAFAGEGTTAQSWTDLRYVDLNTDYLELSEIIVADQDTCNLKMVTIDASGAGAVSDWSGTNADISGAQLSDAQLIANGAGSHTFSYEDLPTAAKNMGYRPKAVMMASVSSALDTTAVPFMKHVAHDGTNQEAIGDAEGLGPGSHNNPVVTLSEVNPLTSSPWTIADFASTQFGVQAIPATLEVTLAAYNATDFQYSQTDGTLITGSDAYNAGLISLIAVEATGDFTISGDVAENYLGWANMKVSLVYGDGRTTLTLTGDGAGNYIVNSSVITDLHAAITATPGEKLKLLFEEG